jgi:hypothetical protein
VPEWQGPIWGVIMQLQGGKFFMKKFITAAFLFSMALFSASCASYTREIAYADFSASTADAIDTDGYNISGEGWKTENKNGLRLLNKGSVFSLQFYVNEKPDTGILAVEHASALSSSCGNNGYSPVTIKLNDTIVVSNFSPSTHSYSRQKWNVTDFLKTGENVISWTATSNLCSSYLLKSWAILDDGPDYYADSYSGYYGSYYVYQRPYIYRPYVYRPYIRPRFYSFRIQPRPNIQRHHEQRQNGRTRRGRR